MIIKPTNIIFISAIIVTLILSTHFVNAQQSTSTTTNTTDIGNKDLLQVDATLIAGLLILLTVSSIRGLELRFFLVCLLGIIPFMVSAVLLINADVPNNSYTLTHVARGFATGGFTTLPILIISLSFDVKAFYKRLSGGSSS